MGAVATVQSAYFSGKMTWAKIIKLLNIYLECLLILYGMPFLLHYTIVPFLRDFLLSKHH